MSQLHASTLINARYRVQHLLAMGGMAEVWVAWDLLLQRTVAVKVLRAGIAEDLEAADRLRAEARAAAMLTSQRTVRVHDFGEIVDDDGRTSPYLVMELIEGDTVRDRMSVPMDVELVRRVVTQVAEALAEAHALDLVHRDIKPANILLTTSDNAKVTDFGISCSAGSAGLTETGLVMGTARYLAPEQVSGQRASAASDVYSLGVVAHEALRGEPMFTAEGDVQAALAHVQQPPPDLPASVPIDLAALVFSMLAKDPNDRPTAAAVAAGPVPVELDRTRALPLVVQPKQQTRRGLLAASVAGVLLLGGLAAASWDSMELPQNQRTVDSAPVITPSPTETRSAVTQPVQVAATTAARPVVRAPTPPHETKGHKRKAAKK